MIIRAAIAFGFGMKIPIFDVHAHGQSHVGVGGQLFAMRGFFGGSAEMKNRRVFAGDHFGAQFDLHRAAVAGVRDEIPDGGRAGLERREVLKSSGEMKPSALTQTRMRLTKIWRSTGTVGFRFAPRTQSYLEFTRPRSTHSRAMPPMPFVSKTNASGAGSWDSGAGGCGVGGRKRMAAAIF